MEETKRHGKRQRPRRTEETQIPVQRRQDEPPGIHSLLDPARSLRHHRLQHGGHGRTPAGGGGVDAQGWHLAALDARARSDEPPHLLVAQRLQPGPRRPRVPHQDRSGQRHPALPHREVGGERGPQDLDHARSQGQVAQRPRLHRGRCDLEHQPLPGTGHRLLGARPDEGLHARGVRHRREERGRQRQDEHPPVGRQRAREGGRPHLPDEPQGRRRWRCRSTSSTTPCR